MAKKKRKRINRNQRRAVIYIRYSSPNQAGGYSIEYQLEQAHAYAEKHGYTVVAEYIDKAKTAKETAGRDSLEEMLNDADKDLYDTIIVFSFNRAFRNTLDALSTHKMLMDEYGIALLSCIEHVDMTNPHGMFAATNLFAMHQLSSEITAEHVKAAMYYAVQKGYYMGGFVPYGYTTIGTGEFAKGRERKKYAPCPIYAPVVREVFDLYISGIGTPTIARMLYDKGIRARNGKAIAECSIRKMIANKQYIGIWTFEFEGYEPITTHGVMPSIIDEETFYKAQEEKQKRKRNPGARDTGENYLFNFAGKIFCGKCELPYRSTSTKKRNGKGRHRYYMCKSKHIAYDKPCGTQNINAENLDMLVMDAIHKNILNKDAIAHISKEVAKIANTHAEDKINTAPLVKRKKELDEILRNLVLSEALKKMPKNIIEEETEKYANELHALEKQIAYAEEVAPTITSKDVSKFLTKLLKQNITSIHSAKMIFDTFVDNITVNPSHISVDLIVPSLPDPLYKGVGGRPLAPLYIIPIIIEL